jgi:hypothetical protein
VGQSVGQFFVVSWLFVTGQLIRKSHFSSIKLVRPAGLEPAAYWFEANL